MIDDNVVVGGDDVSMYLQNNEGVAWLFDQGCFYIVTFCTAYLLVHQM